MREIKICIFSKLKLINNNIRGKDEKNVKPSELIFEVFAKFTGSFFEISFVLFFITAEYLNHLEMPSLNNYQIKGQTDYDGNK